MVATEVKTVVCEQCHGEGVIPRLPVPRTGRFVYEVWREEVTDAEIDLAISRTAKWPRPREKVRWNIAFGKWCGTYR